LHEYFPADLHKSFINHEASAKIDTPNDFLVEISSLLDIPNHLTLLLLEPKIDRRLSPV
jgi:hypothetical protein